MPGYLACIARLLALLVSATVLQPLEIADDSIVSSKAKVVVAGGFDDFSEGLFEFANMGATDNLLTEFPGGREPSKRSQLVSKHKALSPRTS